MPHLPVQCHSGQCRPNNSPTHAVSKLSYIYDPSLVILVDPLYSIDPSHGLYYIYEHWCLVPLTQTLRIPLSGLYIPAEEMFQPLNSQLLLYSSVLMGSLLTTRFWVIGVPITPNQSLTTQSMALMREVFHHTVRGRERLSTIMVYSFSAPPRVMSCCFADLFILQGNSFLL